MSLNYLNENSSRVASTHGPKVIAAYTASELYRNVFKRALDILLVIIASTVIVPVVLILALFVSLDGHSPFYTQKRLGRGGKVFKLLKLRTMVPNADQKLEEYLASNPEARAEWDATQKLKNDPRVTPIGRVLRKASLDELPQFANVLLGSMSIIGPRPMMLDQQDLYPGEDYYELRPGISGLWQVSDRNECDFRERSTYDSQYNRDLSLALDLSVMLRTVTVVLRGTGY